MQIFPLYKYITSSPPSASASVIGAGNVDEQKCRHAVAYSFALIDRSDRRTHIISHETLQLPTTKGLFPMRKMPVEWPNLSNISVTQQTVHGYIGTEHGRRQTKTYLQSIGSGICLVKNRRILETVHLQWLSRLYNPIKMIVWVK